MSSIDVTSKSQSLKFTHTITREIWITYPEGPLHDGDGKYSLDTTIADLSSLIEEGVSGIKDTYYDGEGFIAYVTEPVEEYDFEYACDGPLKLLDLKYKKHLENKGN